jgi:hypothetical protein
MAATAGTEDKDIRKNFNYPLVVVRFSSESMCTAYKFQFERSDLSEKLCIYVIAANGYERGDAHRMHGICCHSCGEAFK